MQVLVLIAFILAVIAVICAAVPTVVLTVGAVGWLSAAFAVYMLDLLVGGWALPVATARRQ